MIGKTNDYENRRTKIRISVKKWQKIAVREKGTSDFSVFAHPRFDSLILFV